MLSISTSGPDLSLSISSRVKANTPLSKPAAMAEKSSFFAHFTILLLILIITITCCEGGRRRSSGRTLMDGHDLSRPLKLTFAGPSRNWTDAIPIGNGRLGATIWGGVSSETLNINGKCKTTSFYTVLETKTPPFDFPFISSLLCCV